MKPCSSHRQMPSPFIAFSWEVCSCLEQQDMHSLYAALQLIGLKPLRLHYNPHSYQSSANALNSLPAHWRKLFSSHLKYFQIHFPTVCSRHFLPANGVLFPLLLWRWKPEWEGPILCPQQCTGMCATSAEHLTPPICYVSRHYILHSDLLGSKGRDSSPRIERITCF